LCAWQRTLPASQRVRIKLELTDFDNLGGKPAFKMLKRNTEVYLEANSLSTFDLTRMPIILLRLSLPWAFPIFMLVSMTSLGT